jgi:hypothetical protein
MVHDATLWAEAWAPSGSVVATQPDRTLPTNSSNVTCSQQSTTPSA